MNKILSLIILFISLNSFAQIYKPLFYNENWELTQSKYAEYFRNCYIDTTNFIFIGQVKDHYKNGVLEMEGQFDRNGLKQDTFKFYFKNGQIKCYGNYKDDYKQGKWKYYYCNGRLKQIVEYTSDDFVVHEYNDSLGNRMVFDGNGSWETSFYFPLTKDSFTIEGQFLNGLKNGKWACYVKNDLLDKKKRIQYTERYNMGKFIKGKWYWGGGAIQKMNSEYQNKIAHEDWKFNQINQFKRVDFVSKSDYPFYSFLPEIDSIKLPVDKNAEFPGDNKQLDRFFQRNLRYPLLAQKKNLETSVLVEFIVSSDGNIKEIRSPKNIYDKEIAGAAFNEEVIRVVKLMPNWIPAERDNRHVDQRVSIFIDFKIIDLKPITQYNMRYSQ